MAYHVRRLKADAAFAVAKAMKQILKDINAAITPKVHADTTSKPTGGDHFDPTAPAALAVTAANGAGTLAALQTLCLDIYNVYLTHLADDNAHKVADPAPALTKPSTASTLGDLQTFLNAVKADYNTHIGSTTYHGVADVTNGLASADATNQASADTLANEIKTDLNAHILLALTKEGIKLVSA